MPEPPLLTLLAIDDDPACLRLIEDALAQPGLEILTTSDPRRGLEIVQQRHPQIVLLDLRMPGVSGIEVLEQIVLRDPTIDVILMTAHQSVETAVDAIRKGASDYLTKPLSLDALRQKAGKRIAEIAEHHKLIQLDRQLLEAFQFEGLIGRSPLMLELYDRVRRVAPHFRTLLITGATGTGKELVARALHRRSPSSGQNFAVCNCSAVVETIFESELFGHVKGAFTGAVADKIGFFEYANRGVLLLDEIGDMPLATQAKLLRALQNREIQRVGSPAARGVDVRVIAATHHDLRAMVAARQFRDDLFYRLSMVEIHVPSLQDRKEDLPLLERHFVEHFAQQYRKPIRGLTRRAQAVLARYHWPGNVREMENALGHACMMTQGELVDVPDLPERLRAYSGQESARDFLVPLDELERRHTLRVLDSVKGNKTRAAEILGISRATLYRLIDNAPAREPQEVS